MAWLSPITRSSRTWRRVVSLRVIDHRRQRQRRRAVPVTKPVQGTECSKPTLLRLEVHADGVGIVDHEPPAQLHAQPELRVTATLAVELLVEQAEPLEQSTPAHAVARVPLVGHPEEGVVVRDGRTITASDAPVERSARYRQPLEVLLQEVQDPLPSRRRRTRSTPPLHAPLRRSPSDCPRCSWKRTSRCRSERLVEPRLPTGRTFWSTTMTWSRRERLLARLLVDGRSNSYRPSVDDDWYPDELHCRSRPSTSPESADPTDATALTMAGRRSRRPAVRHHRSDRRTGPTCDRSAAEGHGPARSMARPARCVRRAEGVHDDGAPIDPSTSARATHRSMLARRVDPAGDRTTSVRTRRAPREARHEETRRSGRHRCATTRSDGCRRSLASSRGSTLSARRPHALGRAQRRCPRQVVRVVDPTTAPRRPASDPTSTAAATPPQAPLSSAAHSTDVRSPDQMTDRMTSSMHDPPCLPAEHTGRRQGGSPTGSTWHGRRIRRLAESQPRDSP